MSAVPVESVMAGVFVGGVGRRMGGCAKGLLEAPGGGTLVERWLRILGDAGVIRVLLVGRREEYGVLGLEAIDDEPAGVGPLGGLVALLGRAARAGHGRALALACDMPFVAPALIARLLSAPDAPVVAPRRDGLWEPLCARYDARRVLPAALRRIARAHFSLQPLLTECGAVELPLDSRDDLRDWDTPDDVGVARGNALPTRP